MVGVAPIRNEIVAVGTTAVLISNAKSRKNIYFRNCSTGGEVITVQFSNVGVAVANTGYILNPNEYISDSDSGSNYDAWDGIITAISTGGGQLTVVERVR